MTILYMIRHAQSTGNVEKRLTGRKNYELTQEGILQAEILAEKLEGISFESAYSSPFIRAIDTITPLATKNNIPVNIDPDLSEMYFGIYDGYKWEEVNRIDPCIHEIHLKTNEIMNIPKQESSSEVAERMYNTILKITKSNIGKNILIASHGVAIEAFLRKISGEPFTIKREEYSQKNISINKVLYNESKNEFTIEILNNKNIV